MNLGFYPFVLVMPVTDAQCELIACGQEDTVCDQIWESASTLVEGKRAPSLAEYKHFLSRKGDDILYRHGIVLGSQDPGEFVELFHLGLVTYHAAKMKHISEIAQRGVIDPGMMAILVPSDDDAALAESGWLLRGQVGRIDCDTSFYDGEHKKVGPGPERCIEILTNKSRYALCIMELYGKKDSGV